MSYYSDLDDVFITECFGNCETCNNKCYNFNQKPSKPPYIVKYNNVYLLSHKKNGRWFTKDKSKARKFKTLATLERHMQYMNIEYYEIIGG